MQFGREGNQLELILPKSPTKHCVELVKQADSILQDLHRRSNSQKSNARGVKMLTNEFLNAMDYLKIRVKSSKNFKPTRMTRPVLTVSEKLGPGCYNISRPTTPQLVPSSGFFLSPCRSSRSTRRGCKTPDFIEKNKNSNKTCKSPEFVQNHNTKIQIFQDLHQKEKLKKQRKSRLKFMESVNHRVKQDLKRNNKEFIKHFTVFLSFLSLSSTVYLRITLKKVKIFRNSRLDQVFSSVGFSLFPQF